MEEPEKFPICLRRSYTAACMLYLAVAVPGYYLFGNAVQPSAVGNINDAKEALDRAVELDPNDKTNKQDKESMDTVIH